MASSRPSRPTWRRWRFVGALNVAVVPWMLLVAAHATTSEGSAPLARVTVVTSRVTGTSSLRSLASSPRTAVGIERCTFIDHTRSVDDYSTTPPRVRADFRTLLTEIRYPIVGTAHSPEETPNAAPRPRAGGYPVIVFAHGYDVTPDTYAALLDDWTRAGYVVVAPFFPDEKSSAVTAQHGADTEGDLANEPADLTFVTRQVEAASQVPTTGCPLAHHLVNSSRIAMAGQSDGANAVATLAYDQGLDPQGVAYSSLARGLDVQAFLVLSGQEENARTYATGPGHEPLLVVQSREDQCNSPASAITLYRDVRQRDKWFLELQHAHHLPPYDGVDKVAFRIVVQTTVRFLATTLQMVPPSTGLGEYAHRTPTLARMFHDAKGPSLAQLPAFSGLCGAT